MTTVKIFFASILILSNYNAIAQTIFTHIANPTNIENNITNINNITINKNENKLLFVTQVFSDYYNNHSFGVLYKNGKWAIQQESKVTIEAGSIYNILAINPSENAFSHHVNAKNSSNNWTIINHPNCNDNPNAVLFVTQNYTKVENPKPIGVRYELGKWRIFNQDRSEMPIDANFNVLIMTEEMAKSLNGETFVFTASDEKTNEYFTHLSNLPYKGHDVKMFVTQNAIQGVSNNHETAVWDSGPVWTVYNKDQSNLPKDAKFNMLVIGGTKLSTPQEQLSTAMNQNVIKSVSVKTGLLRFFNQSNYVANAVITYVHNGEIKKITTKRLVAKDFEVIEIPEGVSDIKLTMQLNDILWVKIHEVNFGINPPNECYQFLGTMENASFDNNCESQP